MEYSEITHILEIIKQPKDFKFHKWLMTNNLNMLMWGNKHEQ